MSELPPGLVELFEEELDAPIEATPFKSIRILSDGARDEPNLPKRVGRDAINEHGYAVTAVRERKDDSHVPDCVEVWFDPIDVETDGSSEDDDREGERVRVEDEDGHIVGTVIKDEYGQVAIEVGNRVLWFKDENVTNLDR